MGASQPLLHTAQIAKLVRIAHRLALVFIAILGGTLLLSTAHAQTPQTSLVTLVTDQTPLNLSNHFGVPNNAVVNQNGDFAFIGEGFGDIGGHGEGSALFLRRAGATAATRLLQFGDSVPGLAGATAVEFNVGGLNSSGHLLFRVDYTVSPPDGQLHRAFLLYNGATYSTVASSDTVAAGSGGQTFGPDLACPNTNCLDDHDDVLFQTDFEPFAATDTVPNQNTFYIAPGGGTPVRVVGLGDTMPGVSGATFVVLNTASQINALGQFLFFAVGFNGTTTINGLFLGSASGVTKVVAAGDSKPGGGTFSPPGNLASTSGELNDHGQTVFVDPASSTSISNLPAVWLYSAGAVTKTFTGPLPNSPGGASAVSLSGFSNLGDAVGSVALTGTQSLVRIHSNGAVDTIASSGQAAPGISNATFTAFYDLDIDNNDRAIFTASLSSGGTGIYQQAGTSTPVLVALEGQSSGLSGGGTLNLGSNFVLPKALDNGSTFFSAAISGGTANFAEFLGVPGNLQALMSTADTLPAGARVRLYLPESNSPSGSSNNNGLFVAFAANLAGGQTGLFVENVIAGTVTRVVSEGDAIPGFGGATFVLRSSSGGAEPFYLNGNGQVAFPAVLTGNRQAILLAGPSANSVTKVVATGDTAPVTGNPTFTSVDFVNNLASLSPVNDSSQVAFYGTFSNGSGIFLFEGGTNVFKIVATGDAVPEGGATFSSFGNGSVAGSLAVNQNGQVAFGASKLATTTGGPQTGLYIGSPFAPPAKVVASGDTRPVIGGTFGTLDPISGFNDSGLIVFEAVNGGGVFVGSGGGIATVATDGTANPGTSGGTLLTSTPAYSISSLNNSFSATNAAIDESGDVVFQSRVTGGTANSGYFRVLNNGGTLGPLQATVLQGQVVTGAGTLGTMFPSFPTNSFFSLESVGNGTDFIFANSFTNTSGATMVGQFFSDGGNFVGKLMLPGDAIPGTGGGVYSTGTIRSPNHNDTPVFDVLTPGGTASQAIVLAVTEIGTVATSTALVSALNPSGIGVPAVFTATVTSAQGAPPVGDIVAFFDSSVGIGVGFTDSNGQATFITSSLVTGSHSITAEYFPNSNNVFLTSTSNVVTQVVSNTISTLLSSTPNPSAPGQSVLFEALVFSTTGSTALPTGTVTFLDGATQIGTGALSSEIATFSTSSLSTGSHNITAQYSGDSNFPASASNPVTQIVQTAGLLPSATALSSTVNPSVAGQPVTFIAPVQGSAGGTPTGTVTFLDGATQIGSGAVASGQATFSTSSLTAGSHNITAVYGGDTNFSGSTSNVVTQVVQATSLGASATALASSVNPSVAGQSVTFTSSVSGSGGGTPTGNVTFLDNGVQIGTGALNNGLTTFSTSSLSAGSHPIAAHYNGDANFTASTSSVMTQSVTLNPTATTLISSLNPSVSTQSVQFSAIVTSSAGAPAGNVTFLDNGAQIGTGALNAGGLSTFTISSLAVGSHSITAQFVGGAIFAGSTSTALTQTVTINPTSTALISSLNPSTSTQFVQFTAIVSSSTGATPAGNVTFFDGANQIGTGTLNSSGQTTFGTSSLSVGSHPITAQYLGGPNFGPSTSNGVTQTVNPSSNPITNPTTAPTFIAVGSSPNPSAVGQSVLITATVSSSTSGAPTGNVNFLDNGTSIGSSALNGSGVATLTTSSLGSGFHPITAQYFGDSNFAASFSALLTQTVGSPTPQVNVEITPIPQNVSSGATVQFTATILNAGTNTGVTWQLAGPGSIDQTGHYTAPSSSSSAATVAIIATSLADTSKQTTITFTIAPDALSYGAASEPPATVAAGSQFTASIQLTGPPSTGPNSTVPFVLSCGNLPVGVTCVFTPPTVTGANPQFNVTFVTTGSSGTLGRVAPWSIDLPGPPGPWYALFAMFLSALAMIMMIIGSRRRVLCGRSRYACFVLVLTCLSVAFLTSCTVSSTPQSVAVPVVAAVTPPGNYQAVVVATPQSTAGNFVQTQLIVPFVVK